MSKENRTITVGDLVDQTGLPPHVMRPFLRCMKCGHEVSANKADYFNSSDTREFICMDCDEPMKLVIKHVSYIEVTPENWQKGK